MASSFQHDRGRLERPAFSTHITTDRLRESDRRSPSTKSVSNIKPQRRSVFREEGLDDLNTSIYRASEITTTSEPVQNRRSEEDTKYGRVTFDEILKDVPKQEDLDAKKKERSAVWLPKMAKGSRPMIKTSASAPPGGLPVLSRFTLVVFLIALVIPGSQYIGAGKVKVVGADATPTPVDMERRALSGTSVCTRWAGQGMFADSSFHKPSLTIYKVANINGCKFAFNFLIQRRGNKIRVPCRSHQFLLLI